MVKIRLDRLPRAFVHAHRRLAEACVMLGAKESLHSPGKVSAMGIRPQAMHNKNPKGQQSAARPDRDLTIPLARVIGQVARRGDGSHGNSRHQR